MTQTGGMGVVQRLLGVFTSPSKTFEDIAARPGWDWLVPVAIIVACFWVLQSIAVPKIDTEQQYKDQMKMMSKVTANMNDAQRAEFEQKTREGIEAQGKLSRRVIGVLFIVGFMLFVPALYRGIAAAFGRQATYKRLLAGYAYTWMIYVIPFILTMIIVATRSTIDATELQTARLLKSNVAAFLDYETTSKPLLAILSSVDVFDIWGYIVGSIAVSKMTNFTRKGAYAVVGSVWGLYICLKIVAGLFAGLAG